MNDIIHVQFGKKEDPFNHYTGECYCTYCKHTWVAVVNSINDFIECPECHLFRGRIRFPLARNPVFTCICGCDLFQIMPDGYCYCPMCGSFAYYDGEHIKCNSNHKDHEETITINKKDFNLLFLKSAMFEALKFHGVESWEHYEEAIEDFDLKK